MKFVEIYDQFSNVYDVDSTLLHPGTGYTTNEGSFETLEEAKQLVQNLYELSKTLGTHEDKFIDLDKGYAELKIEFVDGRKLNRVIYTVDR